MCRKIFLLAIGILVLSNLESVVGWHGFSNDPYHCWPLSASEDNPTTIPCEGVSARWIESPGDEVRAEDAFNVTYELILSDAFYEWTYNEGYFDTIQTLHNVSSWQEAKTWCLTNVCSQPVGANKGTCCIHHVNIHSCLMSETKGGLCGPWIPKSGSTVTHSDVLVGEVDKGNWTSYIKGLSIPGVNALLAHFKFAGIHVCLEMKTNVKPRAVCGNQDCETEEGENCETCPADCGKCPLKVWEISLIALAVAIFFGSLAAVYGYMQYQRMKLLWNEDWIIPPDQISEDEGLRGAFGSMIGSQAGGLDNKQSQGGVGTLNAGTKQVFCRTALVDGKACAVRPVTKQEFNLTKQIRLEVREARECDHVNLVKFVGACIEIPHMSILNEYSAKGSLTDVLLNEEIPLNWAFRFSFEMDIARGMDYLHQKKIIHGHFKASNCVVDDRWTIKVTDFGLNKLRANNFGDDEDAIEEEKYQAMRNQVYVAPELQGQSPVVPTKEADVYAYAIILLEIAIRNDPYGDQDVFSLPAKWKPNLPDFNPDLFDNKDDICPSPEPYNELISGCWDNDPEVRPTFGIIKSTLRKINPSKLSAVDLMMAMMEKYSKHLEAIVADRTADLVAEKAKTDRLLYSMLPRKVADDLKIGKPIDAKLYDICTIYFSDIVGFTTISGKSKPIEVVGLLNKLYITFDEIIDKYDVYKVETIGDAYMVVSGIPDETDHHAREVCDMAIDLVEACKTFIIPHLPEEPLKIRIGLHSGPACAGVVGIKMPRYCLFGDTVNTASRMESNSEEFKIHVSNPCYEFLTRYGKYNIEKRGTIAVKGKGDMTTWWIHGHTPEWKASQEAAQ